MKFIDFIKDKMLLIITIFIALLTIEILLFVYNIDIISKVYISAIIIIVVAISIIVEYNKKKIFYNQLKNNLSNLKEKYLISEIIKNPDFIDGKILKEILEDTGKSMIENVNYYKRIQEDYKEYIELWIHEVKTPIATSKMIIENNKTEITKSIEEEINKVENYTEQALFYARSNIVEKDYIITKANLKDIVNNVIMKNKSTILNEKISLKLTDLKQDVFTDSKWTVFIINQIIQNSIKYSKERNKIIEIFADKKNDKVILHIKDNGIGINKNEISKVFEKGFTGENGRRIGQKSTGIGLYLCK